MKTPSHSWKISKRGLRSDRGQATIEFGLVIIFLMVMVISILEMVVFMHTYNVLADSAKEGVRYAIVHGANNARPMPSACTTSSCVCPCLDIDGPPAPSGTTPGYGSGYGVVKTFAQYSLHSASGMTVTVTYGPADTLAVTPLNKTPNRVQVVVAYPYQPIFGLSWPSVTVNAAAEGRIMN
jgi:Flp pilus assembly protein TadG